MTDDLVKRLRQAQRQYVDNEYNLHARAADRIKELEAALREKDNIAYVIDSHGMTHQCFTIVYRSALENWRQEARAALWEKKSGHQDTP